MARKGVFPIVATLAVVGVVLAVFSQTVMRDSNISTNTMTTEQAYADLSGKMKRIGVQEVSVNPQQLDVSEFLDAKDELPDIDSSYPFVVEGNGDVNIEIFSSGEKAAESGSDSFLTSIDGKKWFITEYYRTAPFNPAKETYDLYKAFAEAFQENEREERGFSEELKEAVKKAYGNGLNAGRHSHLSAPASLSEGRPGREQYDGFYAWYAAHGR